MQTMQMNFGDDLTENRGPIFPCTMSVYDKVQSEWIDQEQEVDCPEDVIDRINYLIQQEVMTTDFHEFDIHLSRKYVVVPQAAGIKCIEDD